MGSMGSVGSGGSGGAVGTGVAHPVKLKIAITATTNGIISLFNVSSLIVH